MNPSNYFTEHILNSQVTLEQTSAWVNAKFSNLMKILSDKQEATALFIELQKQAALTEAEARLTELSEHSRLLRERQDQIAALHDLPDTDLIRVCIPCPLHIWEGEGLVFYFGSFYSPSSLQR